MSAPKDYLLMKKYVLVSADFNTWGGMDRANYEFAWYLANTAEASIHLVSYFVASPLSDHKNVAWHKVPKPLNSYALSEPLIKIYSYHIARRLSKLGARIIANGGNCNWSDVNWVHYVHAAFRPQLGQNTIWSLKRRLEHKRYLKDERYAFRKAKVVIANSEVTRQHLINYFDIPARQVHTIYYGIDPQAFRPVTSDKQALARRELGWSNDRLRVIFVGALGDRRKGFDILFEAWKTLCQNISWDVDLIALGAGSELDFWRSQAKHYKLSDRIQLPGFTRNMPQVMEGADALISPTRYEAYGLGVHEALCCGLPAFVTRSAGIAERYPKELDDLLLNDPPNAEDLVQRLKHWRANIDDYKARIAKFGEQLRQRTWTDMAREIVELIDSTD